MNKICFGCGCKLQSSDKEKEGYIPKEKIDNSSYCQRCFRIIHYGDYKEANIPKNINSIINNVNKNAKYVLFLADFITLDKDIIDVFNKIKTPKMLVINKCDTIPKSIRYELIIESLKKVYSIDDEIKLISGSSGYGVNSLLDFLYIHKINEVYIVGETNAGKSTLINKMMDTLDSKLTKITTSKMENTTLDFIRLKLNDSLTIIDSPGFILEKRLNWQISNKLINPKVYQMKKGQTLFIKDIYFNFSEDTNVTVYLNNNYDMKKYFKNILFTKEIKINNNQDVIIKGIGFINIKTSCLIKISGLNDGFLEIRDSVFGGSYE